MNDIASYKNPTFLETDKKINLIYGLNGTGKSIFSGYLYDNENPKYKSCSIKGISNDEILVYNQQFIKDYFYEPGNLKGIFTLSKENKEIVKSIKDAEEKIATMNDTKEKKVELRKKHDNELVQLQQRAVNKIWEIKTSYSGGDRVLEYCLSGLMGKKDSLFNFLIDIKKPMHKPIKTIIELKKEVEAIQGSMAKPYELLPIPNTATNHIEENALFKKEVIGNENSSVAGLIKKLGNADWVKKGLEYLPHIIEVEGSFCPFCQSRTITKALSKEISDYFDKAYENDIKQLNDLLFEYQHMKNSFTIKDVYKANPFIIEKMAEFENLYDAVYQIIEGNIMKIKEKLSAPSRVISLANSTDVINKLNEFIKKINTTIEKHNSNLRKKDFFLDEIKKQFWQIMRWEYDQTISIFLTDKIKLEKNIKELNDSAKKHDEDTKRLLEKIGGLRKKTVNIEGAINNINNGLLELGMNEFKIEKHSEELYKLVRSECYDDAFSTLSEGEKMIISFLYFRELCKGRKTSTSSSNSKIIVIDDPISSLSHIYIFNISQMIKNDFFNSGLCKQVFILTHSLYFFYEMAAFNYKKREENQKLFRIIKNCDGSQILELRYEEIQNDYHSYWSIIKDEEQPVALIANCMRNIIEYFFGFVEKSNLNNIFQRPELQANKYQAFCRYINRESHSTGQNVFDYKEFNYVDFKEAFRLVFNLSGYSEHYDKMIG